MNSKFAAAFITAVLGMTSSVVSLANAADGTITFNGKITGATCSVSGGGAATGTGNITVQLPSVSSQALANANSTAGETPFSLILGGGANCTNGQTAAMWVETASTGDLDTSTSNLKNHAAGGSNVEIQLVNPANNTQIKLAQNVAVANGNTILSNNQPAATIAGNTATLKYVARYVNAGAANSVNAGDVQSALVYSMQYN